MNLRAIANAATSVINPNKPVTVKKYSAQTFDPAGKAVVSYTEINTTAQVQPVDSYKMQHIDGYTAGGVYKAFYFNDQLHGVTRPEGNDLIILGAETYKVVDQPEGWPDWSKVIGVRQ
ncbi:MAG: phage collar protein [Candidatus Avelusimicrobium sp.]|uniref:phage collar protein n=1 Tax=Candidatus Avelusimicrobium sp. TaxID=3048833 RepID=UPI003F08EFF4